MSLKNLHMQRFIVLLIILLTNNFNELVSCLALFLIQDLSKGNFSNGRPGVYLQQNPGVKETISRLPAARLLSEKNSDCFSLASDFSVEHPRICEICGRCETILNPIVVCSSCKVNSPKQII